MYTDAGHVVDTLIHVLNNEQEFFRDFVRLYESEKAEREYPLAVKKGVFQTRPRELMPLLEVEPDTEANSWGTTRAQRPRFDVALLLTVINSNPEFGVEYITGWVRRLKVVLNDPRRLQSWVTDVEGKRQYKWTLEGGLVPLGFLDSLVTDVSYKTLQAGSLRQARLSWFGIIHEPLPQRAFTDHWPHYTSFSMGPPNTGIEG